MEVWLVCALDALALHVSLGRSAPLSAGGEDESGDRRKGSSIGVVVPAIGFLAIGAIVEALEGLAAATALFGIGCADKARARDIKDGNRKAEQL